MSNSKKQIVNGIEIEIFDDSLVPTEVDDTLAIALIATDTAHIVSRENAKKHFMEIIPKMVEDGVSWSELLYEIPTEISKVPEIMKEIRDEFVLLTTMYDGSLTRQINKILLEDEDDEN